MELKNNYYQAGAAIAIASVGFLCSYPFHTQFWGGLISGGCSAAMIGGLADWFAVTALFRRPLGIRPGRVIRTEIIPRNRERIFAALADMVQDELLTSQAIKQRLGAYNISHLLIRYLTEHGGQGDLNAILTYLTEDAVHKLEPGALGKLVEQVAEQGAAGLKAAPILVKIIKHSLERGYDEKALNFVLDQMSGLVKHPQFGVIIYQLIKDALEVYEKGMDRRRLVNGLLLRLSPLSLAELAQSKLSEILAEIRGAPDHPWRRKLKQQIATALDNLQYDNQLQQRVEEWKNANLAKLELGLEVRRILEEREGLSVDGLIARLEQELAVLLGNFRQNPEQQAQLDLLIKRALAGWLDSGHAVIGSLVRNNLDKFTNDLLVELIEDRVGNDLQMIRINGTVVGGLVGMLIYLATFWLGRW